MKSFFSIEELNKEYSHLLPDEIDIQHILGALRETGDGINYCITADDIAKFIAIMQVIPQDRQSLKMFLDAIPTAVGRKVRSRPPLQIIDFLMSRYPKPQVQEFMLDWARYLYTQKLGISPDNEPADNFAIMEEALSPFHAYAIGLMLPDYQDDVHERYPEGPEVLFNDYYTEDDFAEAAILSQAHYLNYALRRYRAMHQSLVANEVFSHMEGIISSQRMHMDRLSTKLDRASEHTARLKKELTTTQKTSEELLDEALEKIGKLETQLQEERMQYARDVADLFEQMAELTKTRKEATKPLVGLSVAVVGDDSHKNSYREIIEDILGGEMRFCTGLDVSPRLRSTCHWADIIVLITRYMQHKTEEVVRAKMRPNAIIVRVNTAGVASFFRTMQEFVTGLQENTG